MSARRKNTLQLELPLKRHGGKRRGAGRKRQTEQACHVARPRIKASDPLHITLKVQKGFDSLRAASVLSRAAAAFERAQRFGLRVVHFTLQHDHVHLICEADSNSALERGMKSLAVSLASLINKISGAKGEVFPDRFNLHVLKTPTEVKNALRYVLFNWAKHLKVARNVDPFSSVYFFEDLHALIGATETRGLNEDLARPPRWIHLVKRALSDPGSWLLSKGWRRARA